jgi:plastocyanin
MRATSLFVAFVSLALTQAAYAAEVTIDQNHMKFVPDKVVLNVGDLLVFQNSDPINHNIQVVNDDSDTVDIGLQHPGQIVKQPFNSAGDYEVRCTVHPSMLLSVSVK